MKISTLLLPLASLAFAVSAKAAFTVYDNPFLVPSDAPGAVGSNYALSTYAAGWQVYTQANALGPHTASSRVFITKRPFLDAPDDVYGMVAMDGTGGTGPKFTFTTDLSIDPATPDLTFNWLQGNAGPVLELHLAVQVDGQWYASNPGYTTPGQTVGEFASQTSTTAVRQSLAFDPAAENWNILYFTPDVDLSMGGIPALDLSGTITGVGFFAPVTGGGTDIIRFADFTVTAVPEPGTLALGGLAALVLVAASRRRRPMN